MLFITKKNQAYTLLILFLKNTKSNFEIINMLIKYTKYILKHQSGTYQINLAIDIEEFKRHVREGREILTPFPQVLWIEGTVHRSYLLISGAAST